MEKNSATIYSSRQSILKKSFKRCLNSVLTACSAEDFRKAFQRFTPAEQDRLHRHYIEVVTNMHDNMKEDFESMYRNTQAAMILDTIEDLVEEHNLDPEKSNVEETANKLAEAKEKELDYLKGLLEKAEEQKHIIAARVELLKKEKHDLTGAATLSNELRTGILRFETGSRTTR